MKKIIFLLTIVSAISFAKEVVPKPLVINESKVQLTKGESFALAFGMNTNKVSAQQYISQTQGASSGGTLATTPGSTSLSTSLGGRGARIGVNPNFTPYTYGN